MLDPATAQDFGMALRANGSPGILFDSRAKVGGHCLVGFKPDVFANTRQERHLAFVWNGQRISQVIRYGDQAA